MWFLQPHIWGVQELITNLLRHEGVKNEDLNQASSSSDGNVVI